MKELSLFAVVLIILCSLTTAEHEFYLNDGILIKNARIIAPEDQTLSKEVSIIIEKDEIKYIGTDAPDISGTFDLIDAKGKYVIPGLIDSHVHVTSTDGLSDEEELDQPEIVKSYSAQLPKSYLYFGYTTIIDLGTAKPQRLSAFKDAAIKPDLFYVGGGAVIGNGYGLSNWSDSIPNFIYQQNENYPIPEKYSKENHTPQAVIKRIAASGAIAVKTYYEPGFDPAKPPLPTPSEALMETIKKETHKHDMVLVVHGNSLKAHRFLANAEVDVIAHGLWNWGSERLGNNDLIPKEISETLDLEIEKELGYIATLQVINGLNSLTSPAFLNDPELKNVLPKDLITYYKENAEKMYANVFGDAPKNIINLNFNRISDQGKAALKYMHQNGGKILFGTDTPSSPTYGNPPGYNGYLEMLEMEKAGIPLGAILASATIENAKAFNLEEWYGAVEVGKKANILILNKNPLQDITAYNDISQVIMKGVVLERHSLSAIK